MDRAQQIVCIWGKRRLLALGIVLGFGAGGFASGQSFTSIDYPGATATYANGINDAGDIVGQYNDADKATHGFLLSAGKFTQIDYAGAKSTWVQGINSRGDMVGAYVDAGGTHGFLLSNGKFTVLDYPGSTNTQAYGINAAGDIAGMLTPPGKPMLGFLLKGGAWTLNDYHTASSLMNCYLGINDAGVMVGHLNTRASDHGVLYKQGTVTQIDYGGGGNTEAWGINAAGDIVGYFQDTAQMSHGYLLRNGRFTQIDYPGSPHTMAYGINASGQIVGHFQDAKKVFHGFVAQVTPAAPAPVLTVDDDGFDYPGSLRTIQEAVTRAPAGATILVFPGTYRGTVNIAGPEKNALKLIAVGRADEVVLQGDYSEMYGFHLENVNNVVIRGFTVRDFADIAHSTNASDWGSGTQIDLVNSHYNTIEQNHLINGEMIGIRLSNSGNNLVQNNIMWVNNSKLGNCGIHVGGAKSANNLLLLNLALGNQMAGIMLSGAGPGNIVTDNVAVSNGRDGIVNTGTNGTWIEGNRVSYNRGPWGTTPYAADLKGVGRGITIGTSDGVTVFDNRTRNNSGTDISWDGSGQINFDANACGTPSPAGPCAGPTARPATTQPVLGSATAMPIPGPEMTRTAAAGASGDNR